MMRKALLLLLLCVLPLALRGQEAKMYSGVVVSSASGKVLSDVICQAVTRDGDIAGYTFTDDKGRFSLAIASNVDKVQFKLLGYATLTLLIGQLPEKITLQETAVQLDEIAVGVKPIEQSGDTLRYNVGSFKTQGDRYVADVLKKLPGVKVADNGTVSYMGEAINKFYIEGRDLLGGQYNIATNNLDVDAVSSIEVLQNNQHVKALKGLEFEEKAAINLRLKKDHKFRPFGNVELGAGASPLLYDGKGLISNVADNLQVMANVKAENTGNTLMSELEDHLDMNSLFSYVAPTEPYVSSPSARNIPLPLSRYLMNKSYLATANTLVPLTKDSELKLNIAYGREKQNQDYSLLQRYATENDYIDISENSVRRNIARQLRASASYELNSSRRYLKDEALYYRKGSDTRAALLSNADSIGTDGSNTTEYAQNYLRGLFRTQGDHTFQVHSLLRYENGCDQLGKQSLAEQFAEDFSTKRFIAKNKLGTSFQLFGQKLDIGLVANYIHKSVRGNLSFAGIDSLLSAKSNRLQIGLEPSYQLSNRDRTLIFTIKLPLCYDNYSTGGPSARKLLFTPSIRNHWIINHRWESTLSLGCRYDYADDLSTLPSGFYTGYRNIYVPSLSLNHNSGIYAAARLQYKNIVNMLFANLMAFYRRENRNYVNVFYTTSDYNLVTTRPQDDHAHLLTLSADVSKTFVPCHLTLSLSPAYTLAKSNIIQQDILTKNSSNSALLTTKLDWKPATQLNLIYSATGRVSWNDNNLTSTNPLTTLTQTLGLYYFPTKQLDLLASCDYITLENSNDHHSSYAFLDLKARYVLKRLEFGLSLNNVLNKDLYTMSELSSVNIFTQQLPLRHRSILASVTLNF